MTMLPKPGRKPADFASAAASYAHHKPVSSWPQRRQSGPCGHVHALSTLVSTAPQGYVRVAPTWHLQRQRLAGVATGEARRPRDDRARRTPASRTSNGGGYQGVATEETSQGARSPRRPSSDRAQRTPAPKQHEDVYHCVAATQRV